MNFETIITSIITSGIIGVFISEYYQRKTLVKKMKRDFVIEFFSCRFMLKDDHKGDTTELNKTLGKIPIVFSDNKQVIACYDNLFTDNSNKTLLRLIKAMCKDKYVKINISSWDDDMIMRVLSVTKEEDIFIIHFI